MTINWQWQHRAGRTVAHIVDADRAVPRGACGGHPGPGRVYAQMPITTPKPELMDVLRREAVTLCPACLEQEPDLLGDVRRPIALPSYAPDPCDQHITTSQVRRTVQRLLRINRIRGHR